MRVHRLDFDQLRPLVGEHHAGKQLNLRRTQAAFSGFGGELRRQRLIGREDQIRPKQLRRLALQGPLQTISEKPHRRHRRHRQQQRHENQA